MVDILGLCVLCVFYAAILVCGILATRWYKKNVLQGVTHTHEVSLVAGRKLGGLVGVFTMTATTVGGGYINGTAESVATFGLVWTLAPFGICVGLSLGGLMFARKMREHNYLTLFDPFQQRFGHVMVALLYLAAICGDVFWAASILAALGTSLSVIIQLNVTIAIVMSSAVALLYTMFGQLISVAYTDVIQLLFIILGLGLSLPFVVTNDNVAPLSTTRDAWFGTIDITMVAVWVDLLIAMTLGTIPWQTYFQRVLAVRSTRQAQLLSVAGGVGALLLGLPSIAIGAVAVSTDWNATALGVSPLETNQSSMVLPLVLKYLTPRAVSLIGLGAVAAAVMSSIDSAILSSASVFTHNIYKLVVRTKASQRELLWVQRVSLVIVAAIATTIAAVVSSIYGLFILAADFIFVVMTPQLTCALFVPPANSYGSLAGFIVGVLLRIGAGESAISLPPFIRYPYYDPLTAQQRFPFRTFAMLSSLVTLIAVSCLTRWLFTEKILPGKVDFFHCFAYRNCGPREVDVSPLDDRAPPSGAECNTRDQLLSQDTGSAGVHTGDPLLSQHTGTSGGGDHGDKCNGSAPAGENLLSDNDTCFRLISGTEG